MNCDSQLMSLENRLTSNVRATGVNDVAGEIPLGTHGDLFRASILPSCSKWPPLDLSVLVLNNLDCVLGKEVCPTFHTPLSRVLPVH